MGYNLKSLEDNILKCRENILVFEDAIDKERQTIKDLQGYIETMDEQERVQRMIKKNVHIEIDREKE